LTKALTVSFKPLYSKPRSLRAKKAVSHLKKELKKHARVSGEQLVISREVNEALWSKGALSIPRKLEVELYEKEGINTVYLKGSKELKERLKEEKKKKKEKERKEEKKEEKKSKEEIEKEKEIEEKKKEKKIKEMAAEKAAIKRGTM
jgi:ribosomal protein L31E